MLEIQDEQGERLEKKTFVVFIGDEDKEEGEAPAGGLLSRWG